MNKEEVQSISFQLIGYAGDAFSYFCQAVDKAREGKLAEAKELLAEGNKQMVLAHHAQTDLLTAEASGEDIAFSVILVHAQDHMMNAVMYERIAKDFISLYEERSKHE